MSPVFRSVHREVLWTLTSGSWRTSLDAVVDHLTMLLKSPTRPEKRRAIWVTDPSPPSPKGAAAARTSRVGAAHKPPR
jgi:hypothetical protein